MVEEATSKHGVSSSSPIRNWRLIVQVNALISCKINAKLNAKKLKINAKFNANYVRSTLNSTLNMYDQRQLALKSWKIRRHFLHNFALNALKFCL